MRILIRLDGNKKIGFGHISRIRNLTEVMKRHEIQILLGGDYAKTSPLFEKAGVKCHPVNSLNEKKEIEIIHKYIANTKADIIIVDRINSSYSDSYFDSLKNFGIPVVALDDCGNKKINADIVINGTVVREWRKYPKTNTRFFLGPEFMVLNKNIIKYNQMKKSISDTVETVTITTGGSDLKSIAPTITRTLLKFDGIKRINVIEGPYFSYKTKAILKKFEKDGRVKIFRNLKNIHDIIYNSDFVFLTAGLTAYECACIGTPFAAVNQVEHQNHTSEAFEKLGVCVNIGLYNKKTANRIMGIINDIFPNKSLREKMSKTSKKIVDGKGSIRVAKIIETLIKT